MSKKSIGKNSETGGNVYNFIYMAKEVTVKPKEGIMQNVDNLDYMNVVPRSDAADKNTNGQEN